MWTPSHSDRLLLKGIYRNVHNSLKTWQGLRPPPHSHHLSYATLCAITSVEQCGVGQTNVCFIFKNHSVAFTLNVLQGWGTTESGPEVRSQCLKCLRLEERKVVWWLYHLCWSQQQSFSTVCKPMLLLFLCLFIHKNIHPVFGGKKTISKRDTNGRFHPSYNPRVNLWRRGDLQSSCIPFSPVHPNLIHKCYVVWLHDKAVKGSRELNEKEGRQGEKCLLGGQADKIESLR